MSSVHLYVYDLSKGLARQLSFMFIGKQLEGIWHTGIVAYGREWFFGGNGIESVLPKGTVLNEPDKIEHLGNTEISENDFLEMVQQLSEGPFKLGTYHLLHHNCNTFSDQMAQFLVGKTIPSYIIDLPNEVLNTPIGAMLESMFAPQHTLRGNTNDAPVSHISKTGHTMPLSSSASVPRGLNESDSFVKINDSINFKPDIKSALNGLAERKEQLKLDTSERPVFDELVLFSKKTYVECSDVAWSIGKQHLKLSYKILETNVDTSDKINMLQLLQTLSNDKNIANLFKSDTSPLKVILESLKKQNTQLVEHYLQWFTNLASNQKLNEWFIAEQDLVFSNLSELLLLNTETNKRIHQWTVTFFYNLLCVFDRTYKKLSESSGLTIGVALIELIQSERFEAEQTLLILDLLQVCCAQSGDFRLYIESIGGLSLDKYIHDAKCKSIIETINKHLQA